MKVKYGLKNVHYAVATIDEIDNTATYGTPKPWPGAVNLSLDPQGGTNKFRADNIDYWIGQSNTGYEGDLETALVPDDFRKDILGEIEDSEGVLVENTGAKTKYFALLFQFEHDDKAARHVMYKCSATRPAVAGQTTEEELSPVTETVTITSGSIHNAALDIDTPRAKCYQGDPQYSNWFSTVYQSTAAATYATVSFNTDGGSAITDEEVRVGTKATKPADPTKSGYVFDGWYKENTFTTVFDFDAAITADTTVYAKFTQVFTVSFDTDGGTAIASQSVKNGETATKPADPTKTGYTFDDWYEEDTFTNVFDFTDPITADTTVYAKFTQD